MGRIITMAAVFGLMLWYALSHSPEDPGGYRAVANDSGDNSAEDTAQPWSQEERAVWRDNIDQRLRR